MKQIKFIFLWLVSSLILVACETYGDPEINYTPVFPLSGQYRIMVYDVEADTLMYRDYCYISNTQENVSDKCWLRIGAFNLAASNAYSINGKLSCDVKALTFSGSGVENLAGNVASSTETFTLPDGIVKLGGIKTPSGTTADAISFTFTNSRFPGRNFRAEGYRYTGWAED